MIPDRVLEHLRNVVETPDLSGTRYDLVGLIGRGGMGAVYRVRDRMLGREAALKIVDEAGPMMEEAKTLAMLEHPGIVPLYDAGALEDGRGYLVMRLVEGVRLDEYVSGPHGLSARLDVALKICDAVSFAHSKGAVHRDLKPANILVGKFGQVAVLDWGVALWRANGDGSGVVAGTRKYMAPEQAAGLAVDSRSDIYALGVLLGDLLPHDVPSRLAAIAGKARTPDPNGRYESVEELALDLRRYEDQLPVSAYRENPLERVVRFAGRNQVLLLLLGSYVLVRVLLYFWRPV